MSSEQFIMTFLFKETFPKSAKNRLNTATDEKERWD